MATSEITASRPEFVDPHDHVVQFYEHDESLVAGVAAYLGHSLTAGDAAVVVARRDHREALESALVADCVDLETASAGGRYVSLDADEALTGFMVDGHPDDALFASTIGAVTAAASRRGRGRVRAFGEMAAVLWDEGSVVAALEVEELWNRLHATRDFSLYCAYPTHAFSEIPPAHFDAVCAQHSGVVTTVPTGAPTRRFEPTMAAPRAARDFVVRELEDDWRQGTALENAALVVSELSTNAVLHGRRPFHVSVAHTADTARIVVHDPELTVPLHRTSDPGDATGRGLRLVAAVARSWGTVVLPDGKAVWAELAT